MTGGLSECESGADRISHLPDDTIQRILGLLPVKGAARTATLSKQWRRNWRANTRFVFDRHFGRISKNGNYDSKVNKLMMKIYQAMLVHDGPITKFVLNIPGLRRPSPDINHLLHCISKKGLQELALSFAADHGIPSSESEWEMPSAVFSARQLNSLKVWGCDFRVPSWFQGFSKLTHLDLLDVNVSSDFYNDFLPKCPLLHHLKLLINESGATDPHLKAELVAPYLKVLTSNVWNICFKHTPLLSVVWIARPLTGNWEVGDFHMYNPNIVAVFASLPAVQELTVGVEFMQFLASGDVPFRLPSHLHELKVLNLYHVTVHRLSEARVLFCLIMSSPNLHKLIIGPGYGLDLPPTEIIDSLQLFVEAEDDSTASCFQRLEEFTLEAFWGTQAELDLLRFVLATAPLLRRVFITTAEDSDPRKDHKFLKEVTRYKRASKEAEVIYISDDEGDTV